MNIYDNEHCGDHLDLVSHYVHETADASKTVLRLSLTTARLEPSSLFCPFLSIAGVLVLLLAQGRGGWDFGSGGNMSASVYPFHGKIQGPENPDGAFWADY